MHLVVFRVHVLTQLHCCDKTAQVLLRYVITAISQSLLVSAMLGIRFHIIESVSACYCCHRPPGFGQPQPVAPAGISTQPAPPVGQMTAEQHLRMALASGWNPDLAHKRSLQLAFCSF